MLHDLFTIEIIGKLQGGLNNFEHNCSYLINNDLQSYMALCIIICVADNKVVLLNIIYIIRCYAISMNPQKHTYLHLLLFGQEAIA